MTDSRNRQMSRTCFGIFSVAGQLNDRLTPKIAATMLTVAAVLKVVDVSIWPSVKSFVFGSKQLTLGLVIFEFALAAWLYSGRYPSKAGAFGAMVFFVFAIVSANRFFSGEADCGCFGQLKVPPAVTAILDVVLAALLALTSPKPTRTAGTQSWTGILSVIVFAAFTVWACLSFRTAHLGEDGSLSGSGIVVLEPERWIGQTVPIGGFLEDSKGVFKGEWELMVFNFNCPVCREMVQKAVSENDDSRQTAFLEMPPFGTANVIVEDSPTVRWLRLRPERDWFCEVPVLIHLRDGLVVRVDRKNQLSVKSVSTQNKSVGELP